jgi:hypothetical protein
MSIPELARSFLIRVRSWTKPSRSSDIVVDRSAIMVRGLQRHEDTDRWSAPRRSAANTAMGRKNANLRSEMTRLLRRAGVSILAMIVSFDAGQQTDRAPT